MRTALLIVLSTLTGALAAQPIVGPEVIGGPFPSLSAYALAPAGNGFVFAWSETTRVRVTRLDATLHGDPAAAAVELPTYAAGAEVNALAVAADGRSVVVLWREVASGGAVTNVWARLSADARAVLTAPQVLDHFPVTPHAVVIDGRIMLVTLVVYGDTADSSFLFVSGIEGSVMNAQGAFASATLSGPVPTVAGCNNAPRVIGPTCSYTWTASFASSNGYSRQFTFGPSNSLSAPISGPYVAPNGATFAGFWFTASGADVFAFTPPGAGWQIAGAKPIEFDAAGNGSALLFVWNDDNGIHGSVLAPGTAATVPLLIGYGSRPRVTPVSSNEFVVTYELPNNVIAGRIVSLGPTKRRAVR